MLSLIPIVLTGSIARNTGFENLGCWQKNFINWNLHLYENLLNSSSKLHVELIFWPPFAFWIFISFFISEESKDQNCCACNSLSSLLLQFLRSAVVVFYFCYSVALEPEGKFSNLLSFIFRYCMFLLEFF